jgi:LacI family transcriptional regulator
MKKKYVTLKDISKISGYSVSTISRVINKDKYVKKETKYKIESIIENLDYKPLWSARSLRTGKTDIIAVIFKDISNFFYSKVIVSIQDILRKNKKDIILFNSNLDRSLEKEFLKIAVAKRVDGIILASMGESNTALVKKILNENKIPIVLIDNDLKEINTDKVFHNNIEGARILTEHLIFHGHKKIAIVTSSLEESSSAQRLEGYKIALRDNNIELNNNLVAIIDFNEEKYFNKIQKKIKKLFNSSTQPTAIFIASTNLAISTIASLNENKFKIPEDIAIVSFDDYEFVNILNPPLTTLKSINRSIGINAAKLLLKRIENGSGKNFEVLTIDSELIRRRSCGC